MQTTFSVIVFSRTESGLNYFSNMGGVVGGHFFGEGISSNSLVATPQIESITSRNQWLTKPYMSKLNVFSSYSCFSSNEQTEQEMGLV